MKRARQNIILEIIAAKDIETQNQLMQALSELGVKSTQATLSRDIKELKLVNGSTAATRSPANVAFSLDKPADGSSSGGSGGNSGEEENPLG